MMCQLVLEYKRFTGKKQKKEKRTYRSQQVKPSAHDADLVTPVKAGGRG